MTTSVTNPGHRGRRAAVSREDVLAAATAWFLAGRRLDMQALAAELRLGRATIYRWFGSRDRLLGEVLAAQALEIVAWAMKDAAGTGAARLLDACDRMNRALSDSEPLRRFLEAERESALRLLTSSAGVVQPRLVEAVRSIIEQEVAARRYSSPIEPKTMAYAIVRLGEAFIYNDAVAGIRGEVDRLREIEAALLGAWNGA